MAVRAVHFNFIEERKSHIVFGGAELFDLRVRAGFLPAKLVARKAENDEALIFVFLINGFEIFVLRRETAFGCDVDNQYHLALAGAERGVLAVNVFDGDVINTGVE